MCFTDLNNTSPVTNGQLFNGGQKLAPALWQQDPMTEEQIRAAHVHGQISSEEFPMRKPTRLQSLAPPSAKARKKKRHVNTMEPI